jgi:Cysteine-rich secretory protein family
MDKLLSRCLIFAALFLASGAVQAQPLARDDAPATQDIFAQRILAAHNAERAHAGSPPLVWNQSLADDAAVHAKYLARTGTFEHAEQAIGDKAQGENLWMGTTDIYSAEEMVKLWVDEKKDFKPGKFPAVSATGNWFDIGHYTQLIWPGTTSIGCSIQSGGGDDYLVCRYFPAGNVMGEQLGVK